MASICCRILVIFITLVVIESISNAPGQLSFTFDNLTVITEEAVNTSTCNIAYNKGLGDNSYYITYSEFDEIDEQTFQDRVFASSIDSEGLLVNFSTPETINLFAQGSSDPIGTKEIYTSHLPLYRTNISNPTVTDRNTYHSSIAIGSQSSLIVFDSVENGNFYVKYNDLDMINPISEFSAFSSEFTFPVVKYGNLITDDGDTQGDYYVIAYTINANDVAVYTMKSHFGGGTSELIESFVNNSWSAAESVIINNTKIEQYEEQSSKYLLAYDVLYDDGRYEIYGQPFWWDFTIDGSSPQLFEDKVTLLTNTQCNNTATGCKVILQDILPATKICSTKDAFLIVYTIDNQLAMDLVTYDGTSSTSVLNRVWADSLVPQEDDNIYVSDIQEQNIQIYPVSNPVDYNQTNYYNGTESNADFYMMAYVDTYNIAQLLSFYVSGCTSDAPRFEFLGLPKELPDTESYSEYSSINASNICLGPQTNDGKMSVAWFEYSGTDTVYVPIGNFGKKIRFEEFFLYTTTFTFEWGTLAPTISPTFSPSDAPTGPTLSPTQIPTRNPTKPTSPPTTDPTTETPTAVPVTIIIAGNPSAAPTIPTTDPTTTPTSSSPINGTESVEDSTTNTESISGDINPGAADAAAAFEALTNSPLSSPILIGLLILICTLIFLSLLAFCHNYNSSWFPCFWATDDARVGALVVFAFQIWDFASDANFAWCLYVVYVVFQDNESGDADFIFTLFIVSFLFLIIPWLLNLVWIIWQRWKWTRHSLVNAWIRDYAWLLISLCMISGGANPSIGLCNSRIFALLPFQMELPRYEYLKTSRWPLFFVTMFENIPQILVQFAFVVYYSQQTENCNAYDDDTNKQGCVAALQSTALASISSIVAIIFAFGVCLLQCSDPLDDKRFILDIKLHDDEKEERIRNKLGMRRKIARSVAQAIDMYDSVITIEAVKWGYNKLKFVISVTESAKHGLDNDDGTGAARRQRSTFLNKLRGDEDEDIDEIHYDKLLHQILTAKSNGKLAAAMKKVLDLKYMPSVQNIEIPDINEMPNMDDVVQRLKENIRDQDEVVIIASGSSAKRGLSYDDDKKIHQESHKMKSISSNISINAGSLSNQSNIIAAQAIELQQQSMKNLAIGIGGDPSGVRKKSSIKADNDDIVDDGDDDEKKDFMFNVPKVKSLNVEGQLKQIPNQPQVHVTSGADYNVADGAKNVDNIDNDVDDIDDDDQIIGDVNATHDFIQ